MKNMKRIIALALAMTMTMVLLAGCGAEKEKKYKIGICQLVQHEALDAATKGFREAVEAELGKDNVEFDEQNAANEATQCATICNGFVTDGVDLIMANATPALQAAATATPNIPIVATSITDYATALEIKDWNGKTGINVTGTADLAPLDEQVKTMLALFPDAKNVGILYASGEPNSVFQATQVEKALKDAGVTVTTYTVAESNDVAAVTKLACDKSDVVYIPTDNTMASSANIIGPVAEKAKTPIFAGEEGIAKGCGVATLSINYYDIGYEAGKMAAAILKDGKDPAEMDIAYSKNVTKKFVKSRANDIGITAVPDGFEILEVE